MYGRSAEMSGSTAAAYPAYPEESGPTTSSIPIASPTAAAWTTSGGWVGLVATRRGSTHAEGAPNQDAALVARIVSPTTTAVAPTSSGGLVAAVADGHGGRRHVRSDLGARIAVELAVHLVLDRGTDVTAVITPLIDRWRGEVRQHAALNPFTRAEKARAGVDLDRDPVIAYGATLLIAIASGDDVQLAQLGDGDVVVLGPEGPALPIPVDERLVDGETTSLCLPDAVRDVRFARVPGSRLVMLATDGLGNAHKQADWWAVLAKDYERIAADGLDHLAQRLPMLLGQAADDGGDDATVALLLRVPGQP